jgi:F-type H+-transporting ATPase subunit b
MNFFTLLAETEGSTQVESIARSFGVDWPQLVAQIISFCIVSFLLYKLAYKRVLNVLATRRQQIAQGVATAEQIKAEFARTEAMRQQTLREANLHATQLIQEAHAAAGRVQERESQKAISTAEDIIKKAREAAKQDQARMMAELKRDLGRLVAQAAERATGKVLNQQDQRVLAEEAAKVVTE